MLTAFSTALSGMTANAIAVDVISNNLANLNTAGYKASETAFQDLMAQSLGVGGNSNQVGMGVAPVSTVRQFTQGSVQTTNGPTDAAIEGDGFFVVKNHNAQTLYTRAGDFKLDADGNLVTLTGESVQGWSAAGGTINPNGPVGNITVPVGAVIQSSPTTKMTVDLNLDARATADATSAFSAPIQVVDSLGATHVLTATFTKTDANKWSYDVSIPAADLDSGGTTSVATGDLTFDSTGQLTDPAASAGPIAVTVAGLANKASDLAINWNLFDSGGKSLLTQFAQSSAVSGTSQDGAPAGQIVKIGLQDGGLIVGTYSNGKQATVAQLALATIRNPGSLIAVGNNNLEAAADTGAPAIGTADSGGRGKIVGGALEASTSDIAREFTNLLTVQRSYQANSKVVTTSDQMLELTVNLIR